MQLYPGYFCDARQHRPHVVLLEAGLYYNRHGERHTITNAMDEDGQDLDLTDEQDREEVAVIVVAHEIGMGGYRVIDLRDVAADPTPVGDDPIEHFDMIVLEDIGDRH